MGVALAGDWRSGSALRSHRRGHWFEPSIAHQGLDGRSSPCPHHPSLSPQALQRCRQHHYRANPARRPSAGRPDRLAGCANDHHIRPLQRSRQHSHAATREASTTLARIRASSTSKEPDDLAQTDGQSRWATALRVTAPAPHRPSPGGRHGPAIVRGLSPRCPCRQIGLERPPRSGLPRR